LLGSPGRAVEPVAADPLGAGDGQLSAIVVIAVRTTKTGIPIASSSPRVTLIEAKSYLAQFTRVAGGIPRGGGGFRCYGMLLAGLPFRLLLRLSTLS